MIWIGITVLALLVLVFIYDVTQKQHAIIRNFPLVGHFRYWLEAVGPELRQYIVTGNNEERPFSRDERRWIYASSKKENNYFGFGTDDDLEQSPNHIIIKHSGTPLLDPLSGEDGYDATYSIPCAKVLGGARRRAGAFRPASVVNVSAMSFGSLSGAAVEAINRGCGLADSLHNTGEGGVAVHHNHGGGLIWQIGTGYFGCRTDAGQFDIERFVDVVGRHDIKAIELKLSQGAKPGLGGILPAVKLTHELSEIRGVPMGRDCVSPARHSAFDGPDSMLDFVEMLADRTGLPIGIKAAVGQMDFWDDLVEHMSSGTRGVDYVCVDGGEGGTGAGPLVFTDHVALPFKLGISRIYRSFAKAGLHDSVVFVGSGKLGLPESALVAFALGCDMIAIAREPLLAIGCIQAQRCHTNHCPTGITTNHPWLVRGLDPTLKAHRLANYVLSLRKDLLRLSRACGVPHPALVTGEQIEILDDRYGSTELREVFGYDRGWGVPCAEDVRALNALMGK